MNINVTLTKNDLDLIALKENPDFNLEAAMLEALAEFVAEGRCEPKMVASGPVQEEGWLHLFETGIVAELNFDEHEYEDLVKWMANIHPDYLDQAIKNVFRSAIINPPAFVYTRDFDIVDPLPLAQKVEREIAGINASCDNH